ncbi:MAG: MSHA biogenesis protein MshO [Lentisphaeria bacterium]|jgi:MSHA biogenesis protein MshO
MQILNRGSKTQGIASRGLTTKGFTLIELITVMVILGVVAAIGSRFVVTTIDSYASVQERSKLINKGRLVIEQMTRQLRIALPNSVRVSASGNCVEFLPIVAGASYLTDVSDTENLAPLTSNIATAPFSLGVGSAQHVVIGALAENEIFTTGSPGSRVAIGALGAGPHYSAAPLASSHRFDRNSITKRVFITDNPLRFCVVGLNVVRYSAYGLLTSPLDDLDPGGAIDLMAEGVSSATVAFTLSLGSEDVNAAIDINMQFSQGSNQVNLKQQVLVRNVP